MLPSIERTEPARTVIVPRVAPPACGRLRFLRPWLVFGAIATAVIMGTTLWSVALRTSPAGRATPGPAGIDTAAAAAVRSVAALPTTPGAATMTTEAVVTAGRSAASRPRAVAPPPAPVPRSAAPPSVVPPPEPAPTTLPDPAGCTESGALSPCAASSVAISRPKARAAASASLTAAAD